ncbi:hypothetical protein YC2023_049045 [Brassica napus]
MFFLRCRSRSVDELSLLEERSVRFKMVMFRAAVMFLWCVLERWRFVTVMHAPVVSGETRSCSDVGSPGGGDDAGSYLEAFRWL